MPVEEIQLEVGDDSFPGRLNVPNEGGTHGVVVLPGAGHGPYGDIFDRFTDEASDSGFHVLRFQSWTDYEELKAKTLGDLHEEIDAAIALLEGRGCSQVSIVGKSFGGGISLSHIPDAVAKMVLWAPFVMVRAETNLAKNQTMDLKNFTPYIDPQTLETVETPVRILHGNEDQLPFENSRKLVDGLQDAKLIEIKGADHSFLGPDSGVEDVTVEHTMAFLTTSE